ncbi:MAG TPA: TatD family nuclease-associated radical SAM protein [Elusimicrobiales bacterium]|nr:TatD family nuclease-associated radical SAM protein [Elusimicrobiales bacterium]
MDISKPALVYRYGEGLYVNLTNRCPTACVFCIKHAWKMKYRGNDLALGQAEPEPGEVTALIRGEWERGGFKELVFCGYGEPTMRLDALLAVASAVKRGLLAPVPAGLKVRLNTNGLGSLVNGRDIVPELKGLVDSVHISLNTADPEQWLAMMRPAPEYAGEGFKGVLAFVRAAVGSIPETAVTAIRGGGTDLEKFSSLAKALGASCRLRDGLSGPGNADPGENGKGTERICRKEDPC